MYNIKVTILSSSEWHWALSHWCTAITAIRFWNFFIFPNWQFFPSTQWLIIPCTHKLCAPCCLSGLGYSSSTWDNASALRVRRLLLSTVFARFTQVAAGVRISLFLRLVNTPVCGWVTFCYPFIHQWTLGLFRLFSYCDYCCPEHGCASICSSLCFQSFWSHAQKWTCWIVR